MPIPKEYSPEGMLSQRGELGVDPNLILGESQDVYVPTPQMNNLFRDYHYFDKKNTSPGFQLTLKPSITPVLPSVRTTPTPELPVAPQNHLDLDYHYFDKKNTSPGFQLTLKPSITQVLPSVRTTPTPTVRTTPTQPVTPTPELPVAPQNHLDLADMGRGRGLFGRWKDARDMSEFGGMYYDANGQLVNAQGQSTRDLVRMARKASKAEEWARRTGALPENFNQWSPEAQDAYRANINSNTFRVGNTPYGNQPAQLAALQALQRRYKHGFSDDGSGFRQAALDYLNGLYGNQDYAGLDAILNGGAMFNSLNFGDYIFNQWDADAGTWKNGFGGNLSDDQNRIFSTYAKSRIKPKLNYDLSTPAGVIQFERDMGIKVDSGLIGPQVRAKVNEYNQANPNNPITIDESWSTIYRPNRNRVVQSTQSTPQPNYLEQQGYEKIVPGNDIILPDDRTYYRRKNNNGEYSYSVIGNGTEGDDIVYNTPNLKSKQVMTQNGAVTKYYYKNGGKMKYFQQGGAVASQPSQEQQITEIFLAIALNPQETLAALQQQGIQPEQIIQMAKKMADRNPAAKEALYAIQQMQQMARNGAKLQYIRRLRGICPDGFEMQSYKIGGQICTKCVKKIEADKCGGKTKKKACGGSVKKDACGNSIKKDSCGGSVKKDACGGKAKKSSNGGECQTVKDFKKKKNCK